MEQSGTKLKTPSRAAGQDIPLNLLSQMFSMFSNHAQESTQLMPFLS
jgi:hypothetical protein